MLFQFQNGTIMRISSKSAPYLTNLFQFQNGTIMRISSKSAPYLTNLFQFQNGTIMRKNISFDWLFKMYFNSKMVRLWETKKQKHCPGFKYFNSKMVRLWVPTWKRCVLDLRQISIPKWYDYEESLTGFQALALTQFQFQNGTIMS